MPYGTDVLEFEVVVVEDEVMNAFCMPGARCTCSLKLFPKIIPKNYSRKLSPHEEGGGGGGGGGGGYLNTATHETHTAV